MSSQVKDPSIVYELQRIAAANGDLLLPEKVVEAARDKESPLHDRFDWEDSEAAHKWRLHQARNLINVTVQYLPGVKTNAPTKVFVSLHADRKEGGYRTLVNVLGDKDQRALLIADAIKELESFQKKYTELQELANVFEAIEQVKQKHSA